MRITPFTLVGAVSFATLPLRNPRYLATANTKPNIVQKHRISDEWKPDQFRQAMLSKTAPIRGGMWCT